ncbi:DUF4252 domain-containing protein [Marinicella sp. S1101]|uniref:DUF4252 domain-containing protein n=1 Tax=Marinicella marina TaxID=2996016 RepID=UPI002260F4A7|nr:DUF4252 domain-containing protein [Marinicella marina]MCX7553626.1 DUF4252 domain-containing protein [Marinicella marina]MDJ1140250.1 DUF4252 domain-containing protein [Marinicella marina]
MKKLLMVLLMAMSASVVWANDFDELEEILGVEANVKITLGPGMLGLANMFTKDEPEAQAVLSGLSDLSISVYELTEQVNDLDLGDWMKDMKRNLSRNGVEEIVKVADGDERVSIMAKVDGTRLSDLSIMVYEPGDEFVFIRMDGEIDVANLKDISGNFDIDIDGLEGLALNL